MHLGAKRVLLDMAIKGQGLQYSRMAELPRLAKGKKLGHNLMGDVKLCLCQLPFIQELISHRHFCDGTGHLCRAHHSISVTGSLQHRTYGSLLDNQESSKCSAGERCAIWKRRAHAAHFGEVKNNTARCEALEESICQSSWWGPRSLIVRSWALITFGTCGEAPGLSPQFLCAVTALALSRLCYVLRRGEAQTVGWGREVAFLCSAGHGPFPTTSWAYINFGASAGDWTRWPKKSRPVQCSYDRKKQKWNGVFTELEPNPL